MSIEGTALNPVRLVAAALIGLVILLVLIIKFKIQAMVAILIGAISIGLIAGMPFEDIVTAVNDGIGNTLKGIALLVGLGSMFGAILEVSGGAQTLAVTMVRRFGDKKAAWALGITGLVIAMPVFFDAGLIILIPLAFSLAKRTSRSSLFYAIPLLAGLAVGHAFIPPTPGPVLVATMLNVDLGWVIIVGIFCGVFAMIVAGPVWGSICGKKYMIPVPEHVAEQNDIDESKLPNFWTIVGIILIPLVLIIMDSVCGVVPALSSCASLVKTRKNATKAMTVGFIMNSFALVLSTIMLIGWFKDYTAAGATTLPTLYICKQLGSPILSVCYSISLFLCFVSTGVALVYGLVPRFENIKPLQKIDNMFVRRGIISVLGMVVPALFSLIGLTNIIKYGYAFAGILGFIILIIPMVVIGHYKNQKFAKEHPELD